MIYNWLLNLLKWPLLLKWLIYRKDYLRFYNNTTIWRIWITKKILVTSKLYTSVERNVTLAKYINKILQLFGLRSGKIYLNTVHLTVLAAMVRYITSWNSILRIFSMADHIKLMTYLKICQSVSEHWNKYFITGILFFVFISKYCC